MSSSSILGSGRRVSYFGDDRPGRASQLLPWWATHRTGVHAAAMQVYTKDMQVYTWARSRSSDRPRGDSCKQEIAQAPEAAVGRKPVTPRFSPLAPRHEQAGKRSVEGLRRSGKPARAQLVRMDRAPAKPEIGKEEHRNVRRQPLARNTNPVPAAFARPSPTCEGSATVGWRRAKPTEKYTRSSDQSPAG